MEAAAGEKGEGPLEGEQAEAEDEVDYLQNGYGPDGNVKVAREKVPEDLGPEEAFDGCRYLVCAWLLAFGHRHSGARERTNCGREDDEPGPVVLD